VQGNQNVLNRYRPSTTLAEYAFGAFFRIPESIFQ
jgi:hypothetical protein